MNKRSQLGNTIATFIATIIIIIILLIYVVLSGAVKTASDNPGDGVIVAKENSVGLSDINFYLTNDFIKIVKLRVSYNTNKDISGAMKEAGYP